MKNLVETDKSVYPAVINETLLPGSDYFMYQGLPSELLSDFGSSVG